MLSKFSLKAAALVLVGAVSSMAQAPMDIDPDDWNYLSNFKLWGTEGISFGNRPEFYDSRLYDRVKNENDYNGYTGVDPDTLGWVGTAKGDLATGEAGWIDGPIIVGGSITGSKMSFVTGPVRTSTGNISCRYRGTSCSGNNKSGACENVPEIRSNLRVPGLTVDLNGKGTFNVSGRTVLDVNSRCPGNDICDIYLNSIDFANDSRLVVQMPEGGRPTRIFVNKLNFGTHPEIVVSYGKGDLKQTEYQGNLLLYVHSDITFANIDNVSIMGSIVSTGTIKLVCNIVFAGQLIAKNIEVGNEIRAENFVFKKFDPHIELSILDEKSKYIQESSTWETIQVGLSEASKADVSFSYCFEFYSDAGVSGTYAGYTAKTGQIADVGAADASHKFPICNKEESVKVTIPAGQTKADAIYIKPMIDGAVEKDEKLWFQVKDLEGATLASDYDEEKGYQIFIVSNDKLPTVSSELVVNVNEDDTLTFTASEFNFSHSTQNFASVIITSLPAKGSLTLSGTEVKMGDEIAVSSFKNFKYTPALNEFGSPYTTFKYKVVGDGAVDNTSVEYTATVNVAPINDKPSVADVVFTVNELDHAVAGGPIVVTDVSNERGLDTYTYKLDATSADYTAFNSVFEIVKGNDQNATLKVKSSAVLSFKDKSEYVVYATVTDDAFTQPPRTNVQTSEKFKITVKIKNENDAPTIENHTFTIAEKQPDGSDWPNGKLVGEITKVNDPDDDPLSYTIITDDVPFKFLNGTSELVITDGSVLDYETQTSWVFTVAVSDGELSATAKVTVNLTDVNEPPSPPVVNKEYSIEENSIKGAVVGTFEVFDNDKISGAYEALTYTLTGALTGAVNTTATSMGDIFEAKETKNTNGTRTVSILVKNSALLDYEALYNETSKNATYPVTITITDAALHSVTASTKIAILDVNEKFTATGGTFYLQEHSPGGSLVCSQKHNADGDCEGNKYGKIEGVDLDKFNSAFSTLTFKMSSANTGAQALDAANFTVDNQGYIKSAANADFEYDGTGAQHKYTFLVTVSDGGFTEDVEVTVNIEDIEEPKIQVVTEGSGSIPENSTKGTVADKFSKENITDPDMLAEYEKIGDIYEYEIGSVTGLHGSDIFDIDYENGWLVVKNNTYLDYEALNPSNTYTVQIIAHGDKGDLEINRTVVVTDVNERPVSSDTTFTVAETILGGSSVGVLKATDPDSCSTKSTAWCRNGLHPYGYNKLIFSIVDDTNLPFEINQSSGEISLKSGERLRFTDQETYEFVVKITDRSLDPASPPLSTTAKVKIVVTDVNEPAEFKVLSDLYETDENVTVGSVLTGDKIVVYDEDDADVNKLTIAITDNGATAAIDAAKLFEVVQEGKTDDKHLSTFVIKTKAGVNYEALYKTTEKDAIFDVTLSIKDGSGTLTKKTTTLRVNDVNEEPSFKKDSYEFSVKENTTKATSLGVAEATDPDIYNANFGTLVFSLDGADAAQFDINASTGEISTRSNAKFDYEDKPSYSFFVLVTDKAFTKKVPVTVNVIDVAEVPKFPNNIPTQYVDENTKKDAKVGVVAATDDDCNNNHKCDAPVYSLTATDIAANDYKSFKIDADGTIRVIKDSILNFEVKNEYSVRVVATDGSDPTLSSYVDVTIKVNDVNDAPKYEKKEYVFEIHESAPLDAFVGSVVASDEDTWSKLTYSISDFIKDSKDASAFKIDKEGKIYLNAALDFETKNEYQVVATATDNGKDKGFDNYQAQTLVTIKLIDDPDKPVIVDDGKKGYNVDENTDDNKTPTGFEIACYEVQDQDKGQVATLVPFVKDAGNTDADRLFDAKLKKNGSKYEVCLTVKNGAKLNYETIAHEHNVIVSVMDADNQTAEVKKTINIIDVNEMPLISGSVNFSFYEDKAPHVIGKLFPDDLDVTESFRDDIFTVVGGDKDLFEISEDGKIKTKRKFDYETEEKHTFELVVALSDRDKTGYPKLTTQEKLTITLKDAPEVPEITSKEFDVDENSKAGTEVGVLKATDPDGDGKLLFELTEENPYVTVSPEGVIKVREGADIDYEKMQEFSITVIVKDEDGLQSLPEEIFIKVNDLNEAPSIKPQTFVFSEDDQPGTKKGPVEAKDPDTMNKDFSNLTFSLVDTTGSVFVVKPNGDIELKGKLDYETKKTYDIKVAVTDGKSSDTATVTINIDNVIEKSEVEIIRVEARDSVYLHPDTLYVNTDQILVEWKQNGKTKTSLDSLKEGKNIIIKKYKDPSTDIEGADTVVVFYSTAAPVVEVSAKKTKVEADNIFTVVESVDKKDSSIYVNKMDKDVQVIVRDTIAGIADTFDVVVKLDTVGVPNNALKTLTEVAKSQPKLNKNPKTSVKETPVNGEMTKVSYEETVSGNKVTISYNVDEKGNIIKEAVVDENGEKKMTEVIEVSTTAEVKGQKVVVSYKADAKTGKMLYGDSEGNLVVGVPSSSSTKPTSSSSSKKGSSSSSSKKGSDTTSDDVDLKTGVGAFTVTYDVEGVDNNKATVSYVVDEKGTIVANEEGDRGYRVTYTYTNKYSNSANKSVFIVLDKLAPAVMITSPVEGDVVYANYVDVEWCIAIDGNKNNCVKQDTLNFESLQKGVNTIKRIYRDKAGNETVAEVSVMMKKAKDVDITLEKPMIIVSIDSVDKYYSINPPEEDQAFAVSIVNPTTQKEKEVVKGFMDDEKNKKGSGEEPYPGLDGHLGPTFRVDMRLPTATSVGGLATLDDIVTKGDMVVLDEVDAVGARKVPVTQYVKEYCSDEFQKDLSKDYSKAMLYSTNSNVKLWFFTTGGQFIDEYNFDYKVDDPDYVDKAGLVKFFFEMKPDMNGELRDSKGRRYGTGPFIVKTKVDVRSKLRCIVPPIKENSKIGDVLKSSDEVLKRFGYRRPVLHGNERQFQKKSSKTSSTKNSSKSSSKKK